MYKISHLDDDGHRVLVRADFMDYYAALEYARTITPDRMPQVLALMAVTDYIHGPAAGVLVELHAPKPEQGTLA